MTDIARVTALISSGIVAQIPWRVFRSAEEVRGMEWHLVANCNINSIYFGISVENAEIMENFH